MSNGSPWVMLIFAWFRWVFLQWEPLTKCKAGPAAWKRLSGLLETLKESYDEIYFKSEDFDRIVLQRAVRWVMCTVEPLTTSVLLPAMLLESEEVDEMAPISRRVESIKFGIPISEAKDPISSRRMQNHARTQSLGSLHSAFTVCSLGGGTRISTFRS